MSTAKSAAISALLRAFRHGESHQERGSGWRLSSRRLRSRRLFDARSPSTHAGGRPASRTRTPDRRFWPATAAWRRCGRSKPVAIDRDAARCPRVAEIMAGGWMSVARSYAWPTKPGLRCAREPRGVCVRRGAGTRGSPGLHSSSWLARQGARETVRRAVRSFSAPAGASLPTLAATVTAGNL